MTDSTEGHCTLRALRKMLAAHDARHVVAGRIEALDHRASRIERPRMRVGLDPGIGAEIADHHLDGVERPALDRRDAGVGPMLRVALISVIGARALAEIRIGAVDGILVERSDRRLQSLRIDTGLASKF